MGSEAKVLAKRTGGALLVGDEGPDGRARIHDPVEGWSPAVGVQSALARGYWNEAGEPPPEVPEGFVPVTDEELAPPVVL